MSDTSEILKEMAKLTILSNKISSMQEKNLKNFPFIAFDGVKSVKIDYDLSRSEDKDESVSSGSYVTYYLIVNSALKNEYMSTRCKAVEYWVRNLFWKDVTVQININDKLIHKSGENV